MPGQLSLCAGDSDLTDFLDVLKQKGVETPEDLVIVENRLSELLATAPDDIQFIIKEYASTRFGDKIVILNVVNKMPTIDGGDTSQLVDKESPILIDKSVDVKGLTDADIRRLHYSLHLVYKHENAGDVFDSIDEMHAFHDAVVKDLERRGMKHIPMDELDSSLEEVSAKSTFKAWKDSDTYKTLVREQAMQMNASVPFFRSVIKKAMEKLFAENGTFEIKVFGDKVYIIMQSKAFHKMWKCYLDNPTEVWDLLVSGKCVVAEELNPPADQWGDTFVQYKGDYLRGFEAQGDSLLVKLGKGEWEGKEFLVAALQDSPEILPSNNARLLRIREPVSG